MKCGGKATRTVAQLSQTVGLLMFTFLIDFGYLSHYSRQHTQMCVDVYVHDRFLFPPLQPTSQLPWLVVVGIQSSEDT
jgi:tRNA A-37 threonylcarbamoyl transferase component Bud32